MKTNEETVADIVTQLRVFVPTRLIRLEGFDGDGLVVLDTAKLADRIEEAYRRENTLNTKSPENVNSEKVIYNNAKIREALEQVFYIVRMFDDINEVRRRVKMVASALAEAEGGHSESK